MSRKPPSRKSAPHRVSDSELAAGLRKTLEGKYGKVLEAARRKWEREFGAIKDPSDASVSVRVSAPKRKPRAARSPRRREK